ncbi:MAG: hypothetical protein KGR24_03405 [Planctomycetes bacterium]|nr:hypothetical protein [Planctomycetota bacterium]
MSHRQAVWTWSALAFVVVAALLGAIVDHYAHRVLRRVDAGFGYTPDPAGTREFLRELDKPGFRTAGAEIIRAARGRDAYLYRYADKAHRARYGTPYGPENQGSIGTCVGFGFATGSYVGQCVDWSQGGLSEPPLRVSVEPLYAGSRTWARMPPVQNAGYSDGSYGAAAARWVSGRCKDPTVGGILFRQRYGAHDLTNYEIPRAKQWGASGPPLELAKLANQHTAREVALIEDWSSAVAALENGLCIPICSNVGFRDQDRDADGFLQRRGNWAHCMVLIGVKYAANNGPGSEHPMQNPRDGVLVMNSWGANWVKGGKHPPDQPDGSFYITRADAELILSQGDSFVIGSVDGFKARTLNNKDWGKPDGVARVLDNANWGPAL